jgi:hypothetical protein
MVAGQYMLRSFTHFRQALVWVGTVADRVAQAPHLVVLWQGVKHRTHGSFVAVNVGQKHNAHR